MRKRKRSLKKIKKELSDLGDHWVVIYGSYLTDYFHQGSDIDVAVITREKDPKKNKEIFIQIQKYRQGTYDLKVFELLPLPIKASIMENYEVLFGPELEISEYFYHYRSLWKDVKRRYERNQFKSVEEKLKRLKV